MSKLRYIPYAVLTAGLFLAGSASAQTWYDAREANQQQRIQDGRRDGSLTRSEYNRLENGQQRIEQYERRAERDGRIDPRERARLDSMLDRQSREINQQRHDGQIAWGRDRNHDGRPDGHGNQWNHDGRGDGWNRSSWGQNNWGHNRDGRDYNGGWNHNNGNHYGWNQSGNWQHNGSGATHPDHGPRTGGVTPPTHTGGWNGSHTGTRPPVVTPPAVTTPTQASAPRSSTTTRSTTRTASTTNTGGGRSFGGGHR